MIEVDVIGIDQVNLNIKMISDKAMAQIRVEMNKSAYKVLADSKRTLKSNSKHVTGVLINSGRVLTKPNEAKVEFAADYAKYVEFGRRAGKRPPPQPIQDWVKKKGIESDPQKIKGVAFMVARKIGAVGIKKSPYLKPAFERERIRFKNKLTTIIK